MSAVRVSSGDVVGPGSAVDGELAVYSGTTGKLIARLAQVDTDRLSNIAVADRMPSGSIVQTVWAPPKTDTAGAGAIIPLDDTPPQIGEGTALLTLPPITLRYADSKVRINLHGTASINTVGLSGIFALFRGSGPAAIAARAYTNPAANYMFFFYLDYLDTPGTVGPHTYSVRVGLNAAGLMYFNGTSASRFFGSAAQVVLSAQEIKA